MDFSPGDTQSQQSQQVQQRLMKELVRLYRLSASEGEFRTKLGAMTDDPDLVEWATKQLYAPLTSTDQGNKI